jgi:hypothetical protein
MAGSGDHWDQGPDFGLVGTSRKVVVHET